MKKVFLLVISIAMLGVVGCNSTDTKNDENEKQNEQITKVMLSDNVKKIIEDNLATFTEGTAFDGSTFKVELDKNDLKVSVIKDIKDIMSIYKTNTSDDTVDAIKKSLTFDDVYEAIKEEVNLNVDCMQVYIFNGEEEVKNNDYYTLKTIM